MKSLNIRAKGALRSKFTGKTDAKGYVLDQRENLLPGIQLEQFFDDLNGGDGKEWETKFRAIHSSSALVVNTFAQFKSAPHLLSLEGRTGASGIEFEKQFTIFRGGRPPNLDIWVSWADGFTAIESKLVEHLSPKKPSFSAAYDRLRELSDPSWWQVYEDAKQGESGYLDRAQLIKHYFGLLKFREKNTTTLPIQLLYLFWEPENAADLEVCQVHRKEVTEFAAKLSSASIPFRAMTYAQLWSEWLANPLLRQHAQVLTARYGVSV